MADIDVVPKRRTGVWIWLLVAIAIIVVLWVAFGRSAVPRQTGQMQLSEPVMAIYEGGVTIHGLA